MLNKLNLHLHTNYSDGHTTMEAYVQYLKEQGYHCLITSDHDYMMNEGKYIRQLKEAQVLSKRLNFPILNFLEISLWDEEAILISTKKCLRWFKVKDKIQQDLKSHNYESLKQFVGDDILCLVHPRKYDDERMKELYSIFKVYEIGNSGCFWNREEKKKLRLLMPNAITVAGLDMHGIHKGMTNKFEYTYNIIFSKVKTEKDLINIIRSGKIYINYIGLFKWIYYNGIWKIKMFCKRTIEKIRRKG